MTEHGPTGRGAPKRRQSDAVQILLVALFARLDNVATAVAGAVVFALGLFLATAILLLKGAPPGVPVGQHLSDLGTFLPGYSVSWAGGAIGAVYAGIVGAILGYVISTLWNFAHFLFIGLALLRGNWLD
ncbi:MAG: hypothetical protein ACOY99_10605 [Pseudomonadota bacterium]